MGASSVVPASPARWRSAPAVALVALLASLLSHAFVLESPLRTDDMLLYDAAEPWLVELGRIIVTWDTEAGQHWRDEGSLFRGNYRPVDWAIKALELAWTGSPDPLVGHAVALVMHAACAIAVALVGRALFGSAGGMAAGVFMAVTPAGTQALTYIGSRGDVLVGLFGALSVLVGLRPTTTRRGNVLVGLASGLMAAFALSSKVVGLPLVLLPFLCALLVPARRSPWSWLPAAAVLGAGLVGRYLWLGDVLPLDYRSHAAPALAPTDLLSKLGSAVLVGKALALSSSPECAGPLQSALGVTDLPAVALVIAGLLAACALVRLRAALLLLTWLGAASLPAIAVWAGHHPLEYNRVLYSPAVPFALLLAGGVAVARAWPRARLPAGALAGLLLVLWCDALLALAELERLCVDDARVKSAQITSLLEDEDAFLVVDGMTDIHCGQLVPNDYLLDTRIVRGNRTIWWAASRKLGAAATVLLLNSQGTGKTFTVEGGRFVRESHGATRIVSERALEGALEYDIEIGDDALDCVAFTVAPGGGVGLDLSLWRDGHAFFRERLRAPRGSEPRTLVGVPTPAPELSIPGQVTVRIEGPGVEDVVTAPPFFPRRLQDGAVLRATWEQRSLVIEDPPADVVLYRAALLLHGRTITLYWLPDAAGGRQVLPVDRPARSLPPIVGNEGLLWTPATLTIVTAYCRERTLTSDLVPFRPAQGEGD